MTREVVIFQQLVKLKCENKHLPSKREHRNFKVTQNNFVVFFWSDPVQFKIDGSGNKRVGTCLANTNGKVKLIFEMLVVVQVNFLSLIFM